MEQIELCLLFVVWIPEQNKQTLVSWNTHMVLVILWMLKLWSKLTNIPMWKAYWECRPQPLPVQVSAKEFKFWLWHCIVPLKTIIKEKIISKNKCVELVAPYDRLVRTVELVVVTSLCQVGTWQTQTQNTININMMGMNRQLGSQD